jgi:hypothetical protein
LYIWTFVLRVPELKGLKPESEETPTDDSSTKAPASAQPATKTESPMAPPADAATNHAPAPVLAPEKTTESGCAPEQSTPTAEASEKVAKASDEGAVESVSSPAPIQADGKEDEEVTHSKDADSGAHLVEEGCVSSSMASDLATAQAEACDEGTTGEDVQAKAETADHNECSEDAAQSADDTDDDSDGEKQNEEEADDEHVDPEKAQELKLEGNELFKANKLHDAREAYSEALYLTPVSDKKAKAVLFSNRAAVFQKLSRWEEVIEDCKHSIDNDPMYAKAYHRRSAAYEALSKWHDANEDLKKVIELDPAMKSKEFKHQVVLEQRAQEQFEKDKEEMMGKLKDFGNMVLGKFGMSTDNFACEKDPDSGSYSIKFQK